MLYLSYSSVLILKTSQSQQPDTWKKNYDQNEKWEKKKKKRARTTKTKITSILDNMLVIYAQQLCGNIRKIGMQICKLGK